MSFRMLAFAFIALAFVASPANAHSVKAGTLVLTDLWTRATPPGAPTAAGYLTITNNGTEADKLIEVGSPGADTAGLHTMETKDGLMTMRAVGGGLEIPAGGTVTLAPGGFHIMFVTLKAPLEEGEKMPVTLTFAKAGVIDTFLHIMAIGADGPDGGMAGMNHEAH